MNGLMTMLPPTVPSSMYALASQYPHYARTPMNLGVSDYAKWAPLVIGDHYVNSINAYGINGNVNAFEEQKDFDQFDAGYEFGRSARLERAVKPCRHGNRCRFFLNPNISSPCHFYHPPSTTTTTNGVGSKNFDAASVMCMPATTLSRKQRKNRNRAKNY